MSRGGRPRKQGKREKSGRVAREPVHKIRETVATQRCLAMGWQPTMDNQKKAASATFGTAHGRLFGRGKITADQYAAAELFQRRDCTYRSAKGLPMATVSAQNIEGSSSGTPQELDEEEARERADAAASALRDVQRALIDVHAIASVTTLVVQQDDVDDFALDSVRRGLQAVFNLCVQGQRKRA